MTPPERAQYLIKEYGLKIAIDHCNWVIDGAVKDVTRLYWKDVLKEILRMKEECHRYTNTEL